MWRGVHRETGQVAAVKRTLLDPTARARFRREVEVQSDLDHPNVMPIWEFSIDDGWYAMPLAERNLTRAIEEDRDINGYQLAPIIREIALGLDYAHRRNYIHRDVNPNNCLELRDDDGAARWVIADWGLVRRPARKSSPRLTRESRPLGTDGFVAPEALLDSHGADACSDVYSLGRVAHFALTSVWPRIGFPMPQPGWLWEDLVEGCTAERESRIATMRAVGRMARRIEARAAEMDYTSEGMTCPRCHAPMTGARCDSCGRVWD